MPQEVPLRQHINPAQFLLIVKIERCPSNPDKEGEHPRAGMVPILRARLQGASFKGARAQVRTNLPLRDGRENPARFLSEQPQRSDALPRNICAEWPPQTVMLT
jgi:hypothetical protein